MRTIETIDLNFADKWEVIVTGALTQRLFPAISPINSSEILIMGGDRDAHEKQYCSDAVIFNTNTRKATKVANDCGLPFICSVQSERLRDGTVCTLILDRQDNAHLVSFTRHDN